MSAQWLARGEWKAQGAVGTFKQVPNNVRDPHQERLPKVSEV